MEVEEEKRCSVVIGIVPAVIVMTLCSSTLDICPNKFIKWC